jgi:hypothetical protein
MACPGADMGTHRRVESENSYANSLFYVVLYIVSDFSK